VGTQQAVRRGVGGRRQLERDMIGGQAGRPEAHQRAQRVAAIRPAVGPFGHGKWVGTYISFSSFHDDVSAQGIGDVAARVRLVMQLGQRGAVGLALAGERDSGAARCA
jgi:hypothetical protein